MSICFVAPHVAGPEVVAGSVVELLLSSLVERVVVVVVVVVPVVVLLVSVVASTQALGSFAAFGDHSRPLGQDEFG